MLLNREWYISTDVSGLFANVITRIHYNQSLSELLDNRSIIEKVVKQTAPSIAAQNDKDEAEKEAKADDAEKEENSTEGKAQA